MKLIIYSGLHKTGTSTIQNACARNRRALMDSGVFYPVPKGLGGGESPANHTRLMRQAFRSHVPKNFAGKEYKNKDSWVENTGRKRVQDLLDTIISRAQGRDILIAAENISTMSENELQEISNFFARRSYSIDLYCCLRKPKEWLNSLLAQRIAGEQGPGLVMRNAIIDLLKQDASVLSRAKKMANWQSDCHFFSFEKAAAHPHGIFANFLELIGIDALEQDASRRDNVRYCDLAVRIISLLMKGFGHRTYSLEANRFFLTLQELQFLKDLPGRSFSLIEKEAEPFKSRLAADNQWLEQNFGKEFCDTSIDFPETLEPIALTEVLGLLQDSRIRHANVRAAIEQILRAWPRLDTSPS